MTTSSLVGGRDRRSLVSSGLLALGLSVALAVGAEGQRRNQRPAPKDTMPSLEVYGFGQADVGYDFKRTDPNWFDVNRPSKLPAFDDQFGANGNTFIGARQSRFGVKGWLPTSNGDVFAMFEFDMFGVGPDAGQTTIRLRHAYGQWKQIGAGQTNSQFMDVDVFPNILDYWGPNGMLFFRNAQVYWRPLDDDKRQLTFALERPGATGDQGRFADRIELSEIIPHFPAPDVTGGFKYGGKWGYAKLGGAFRYIGWKDVLPDTFDFSDHVIGWGASLSSNLYFREKKDIARLQLIYGHGIENYFNDAPVDVGAEHDFDDPREPLKGKALPIFGAVAYLDHTWNSELTSAIGWSMVNITNSDAQAEDAFHNGQYASANVLWTPVKNVMMGGEFQWGRRANFADDWRFNDYRLHFAFKYSFSQHFGVKRD
jgi:hypothetical protein